MDHQPQQRHIRAMTVKSHALAELSKVEAMKSHALAESSRVEAMEFANPEKVPFNKVFVRMFLRFRIMRYGTGYAIPHFLSRE